MTSASDLKIGVVLEAFLDQPLEEVLTWLSKNAPKVTAIEVGAGGYAPHPHCDVDLLMADADARKQWLAKIHGLGFELDALNVWGNPLHPLQNVADSHDAALRNAITLATELGCDRIVAMAGCPAAKPGDKTAHFAGGGWLPYLEDIHTKQWDDIVVPYWDNIADLAKAANPDLRICIELHPGTVVYNVETFNAFTAIGPALAANLDPSHFFWMQMDGHAVVEAICDRIGHVHGKDTTFNKEALALNGLLDHRWPKSPELMPWNFSVPGAGHDQSWWDRFVELLDGSQAKVISIEHEDPFVPATQGVPEAADVLQSAIDKVGALVR